VVEGELGVEERRSRLEGRGREIQRVKVRLCVFRSTESERMAAEMRALREYVTSAPSGIQNRGDGTVLLQVTHSNLKAVFMELRFDMHMTIAALKEKLMSHVGTNASAMTLSLKSPDKALMFSGLEDARMLGFYSPTDGCILHVMDSDPFSLSAQGGLEDVSKVEKYEISEEDYNARENTYRKFKEQKLKEDPTWTLQKEIAKRSGKEYKEPQQDPEFQAKEAEAVKPGMRCEVFPGGKRGEVMYVGKCEGLPLGFWVGVKYDEPIGKNDGQVKGKRYFECAPKYGGMVRPANLKVGDFPPVDDDIDFSDSEEEI